MYIYIGLASLHFKKQKYNYSCKRGVLIYLGKKLVTEAADVIRNASKAFRYVQTSCNVLGKLRDNSAKNGYNKNIRLPENVECIPSAVVIIFRKVSEAFSNLRFLPSFADFSRSFPKSIRPL